MVYVAMLDVHVQLVTLASIAQNVPPVIREILPVLQPLQHAVQILHAVDMVHVHLPVFVLVIPDIAEITAAYAQKPLVDIPLVSPPPLLLVLLLLHAMAMVRV
jgi:hypothetical protein